MALFDTTREDLSAGQIVVVIARWLLIATGFAITLWSPIEQDLEPVKVTVGALFVLAVGNFFLHARLLMGRPVPSSIAYGASGIDIGVITLVIWAFGGSGNPIFVFYYTALLALALVFPMGTTALFTAGAMAAYTAVSIGPNPTEPQMQILVLRLVSLAAVAVIGTMYQHIEQQRREANQEFLPEGSVGARPAVPAGPPSIAPVDPAARLV